MHIKEKNGCNVKIFKKMSYLHLAAFKKNCKMENLLRTSIIFECK